MSPLKGALLATALALAAAPALAADEDRHRLTPRSPLDSGQRDNSAPFSPRCAPRDWAGAAGRLGRDARGPLHDLARAMLYTMPGRAGRAGAG